VGASDLVLAGDWDPAGFFDRLVARAGGFFGVASRGTRAATGAAAATRLRERLGLVLSRGPAIVSAGVGSSLNRSSSACSSRSNRSSASTGSVSSVSRRPLPSLLGSVDCGRRPGLLQPRPLEHAQAASTVPLKSHEALALTRAQQIDQPMNPYRRSSKPPWVARKSCLTLRKYIGHRAAVAALRIWPARRTRQPDRPSARRVPRSGRTGTPPRPRPSPPRLGLGLGAAARPSSRVSATATGRLATTAVEDSLSSNFSLSSTMTLRPVCLSWTRPDCASFSTKSRNDDAP